MYSRVVSDSHSVRMSTTGLPSTILPEEDPSIVESVERAAMANDALGELSLVVAKHPRSLVGWAAIGRHGRTPLERYAYYRVGYHRGLDALRQNGWRGSGYVRWSAPTNRSFLRCLLGLSRCAAEIGEVDEAERCRLFLEQLDSNGIPAGE